jgi:serine protease
VSWSGSDATSGVSSYDVLVATDGGPYTTWKQGVGAGSAVYTGAPGHVYRISAVAHDVAGNVSLLPPTPHATTAVRDATSLTAGSAKTITYGGSLVVSTLAKDVNTGAVLSRLPVVLYKRPSSTAAWTKVASLTTSTAGIASSTQAPKGYTQFQWRFAGDASHAAVNSGVQVVSVAQTVSARATASSVVRGSTVKVYGTVAPTVTNQVVYLQQLSGSTWRTVTSARLIRQRLPNGVTATGFVLTVKPSSAGTYRYRVYKPAVTGLLAGYSVTVTVAAR